VAASRGESVRLKKGAISVPKAAYVLRQARVFLSNVTGPPDSQDEQRRLISTLHALDHASRLAETAGGGVDFGAVRGGPDDVRAGQLCADAMRSAASVAGEVAVLPGIAESPQATSASRGGDAATCAAAVSTEEALAKLERCAMELGELRRTHRSATLGAVADGRLTADAAIVRVDTLRNLEALAHHAWRSSAHLVGRGE
jgi:phosphate:Na+ symporter